MCNCEASMDPFTVRELNPSSSNVSKIKLFVTNARHRTKLVWSQFCKSENHRAVLTH